MALLGSPTVDVREPASSLGADEVHVWVSSPPALDDAALARCADLLSEDERERVLRFHFLRHQREATVSRALVRKTLARYIGRPASAVRYRLGPHGRPHVDPPCRVAFNSTNHAAFVACAVSLDEEIGVDTEPLCRGDEILEIASTVFSPPELTALAALPVASRPERAVSLWTCKEAYIKARSLGLSADLQKIVVDFPSRTAPRLRFLSSYDEPDRWWLATHDMEGFRIAVAVRTAAEDINLIVRVTEWSENRD